MFVKKCLFLKQLERGYAGEESPFVLSKDRFSNQIESIEAYIKAYHYSNFDEVYRSFDRKEQVLVDQRNKISKD